MREMSEHLLSGYKIFINLLILIVEKNKYLGARMNGVIIACIDCISRLHGCFRFVSRVRSEFFAAKYLVAMYISNSTKRAKNFFSHTVSSKYICSSGTF